MTSFKNFTGHLARALAVASFLLLLSSDSKAACVAGRVTFFYELGNFCDPADRSCVGWNFTKAIQNTLIPIKEVIYEVRTTGGAVLATGETDLGGNYSSCYSGTQTEVNVQFHPEHASGAFKVQSSTGGQYNLNCTRPGSGTSDCNFGANGSPSPGASVYYTAFVMLKNVVNLLDIVWPAFTNVQIRMDRPASSTWGYDKIINIADDPGTEFGFATTMHEIGHVVYHLASRNRYTGPDTSNKQEGIAVDACGGDGHWSFFSTDECQDTVYVEGVAEFLAATARQVNTTVNPCTSRAGREQECHDGTFFFDLEQNFCPSSGRRQVRQVVNYLWDTFDNSGDTLIGEYDNVFSHYPNGRANREKSENWCCTFWTCSSCNHDNKNMADFEYHLEGVTGNDTSSLMTPHCL